MMMMDDNDGQMIFGDIGGLKLPDICLTGEEKPRKNLTQETCPDRGSNPGPLRDLWSIHHNVVILVFYREGELNVSLLIYVRRVSKK